MIVLQYVANKSDARILHFLEFVSRLVCEILIDRISIVKKREKKRLYEILLERLRDNIFKAH